MKKRALCTRCTMTFRIGRRKHESGTGERLCCPVADCSVHFYSGARHGGPVFVSVTEDDIQSGGLQRIEVTPDLRAVTP